jgi:hypothetical protein
MTPELLPNYGLANTVTGFATFFAGVLPLLLCHLVDKHPPRWMFVYWLIVVTGIFTVTLHGFGETNPVLGQRWFWAFLDTGSNIVVAWGISRAVLLEYYSAKTRKWAMPAIHALMTIGVAWHFVDRWNSAGAGYLIDFGSWGGFRPGQTWLILFSLLATVLFFLKRRSIPPRAMPVLILVTMIFLCGLGLATAKNSQIVYPFIPMHALWHIVGAFGFVALWFFNDVRFRKG